MKRTNSDGVLLENSIYMIEVKKNRVQVLTKIAQLIALVLGGISFANIFVEAFAMPVNPEPIFISVFVVTVILFLLGLVPSYSLVKLFFEVLFYTLFAVSRYSRLCNGIYIIENLVLDRIKEYYGYDCLYYKADYTTAVEDTTLLLVMILIPFMVLLAQAVLYNKYLNIAALILFVPVVSSFSLGIIPTQGYLLGYLLVTIYLFRSSFSFPHTIDQSQKKILHRISSQAAFLLCLFCLLLFLLMQVVVPREEYANATRLVEIKKEMQTAMTEFSVKDFSQKLRDMNPLQYRTASGGLSGGALGKTGQVRFRNEEHLVITAPYPSVGEGIYLKGYVGSVYSKDRWEGLSKEDEKRYQALLTQRLSKDFVPVNQMNLFLKHILGKYQYDEQKVIANTSGWSEYSIYQGIMKIEYKAANKNFLYAPYFTDYERLEQTQYIQDLYCKPTQRNDRYSVNYFFSVSIGDALESFVDNLQLKLGDYYENEILYRDYVYQVYTKLPEDGLDRLKEDFTLERVGISSNNLQEKILYVKNYLESNTQYSLSPGKLPKDKDFIEYFLYENRTGYCAHYASAATMMLRSLGVPARYVEGYAVGESEIKNNTKEAPKDVTFYTDKNSEVNTVSQAVVSVKDNNAHAWVEVYIDGCGWIPVEFTPGARVDYTEGVVADLQIISNYMENKEEKKEEIDVLPPEPTNVPEMQAQKEQQTPASSQDTLPIQGDKNKKVQLDFVFLIILIGTLIAGASFTLVRWIKNRNKNKGYEPRTSNAKALLCYAQIERMLIYLGGLPYKNASLEDHEAFVRERERFLTKKELENLMDISRRARFGKGDITQEELLVMESYHQTLRNKLMNVLPFHRKMFLRLFLYKA